MIEKVDFARLCIAYFLSANARHDHVFHRIPASQLYFCKPSQRRQIFICLSTTWRFFRFFFDNSESGKHSRQPLFLVLKNFCLSFHDCRKQDAFNSRLIFSTFYCEIVNYIWLFLMFLFLFSDTVAVITSHGAVPCIIQREAV